MTSYPGPWIQAPDYVADGYDGIVSASPYGDAISYEQHLLDDDDPPTVDPDYYTGADIKSLDTAATGQPLGPTTGVFEGFIQHEISYGVVSTPDGLRSKRTQEVWRSYRVSALSPESQGLRYWAPTPFVGITPPPDAIGWEWQDPAWTPGDSAKSEVLRLEAEFHFRPTTTGDSNSSLYGPVLLQTWFTAFETSSGTFVSDTSPVPTSDADWLTEWDGPVDNYDFTHGTGHPSIFGGVEGVLFPDAGNPSGPALVDTYDLTSKLDDKGRVVIASSVSFQAGEPSGHVTPWSATGQDPLLLDDDTVRYGHAFNIVPHWTLRPPVFRWLYAEPQITSAPPLRHTQRDDKHGPSPRNKPARTRQAGHRNTGYL